MRVISRSSAFLFKGKGFTIPAVAKKLKVAHVLDGSVRKADGRVRITVQLIDTRSDTHLWSDTYDRKLDNILPFRMRSHCQWAKTFIGSHPQAAIIHMKVKLFGTGLSLLITHPAGNSSIAQIHATSYHDPFPANHVTLIVFTRMNRNALGELSSLKQ